MSSDVFMFNSGTEAVSKLSDCDIIEETPQKVILKSTKIRRKKSKLLEKGSKISLNQSEHLPFEYQVVRNQYKITKPQFEDLSCNYKCPHVFYDFEDFLRFTDHCTPVNVNIKLFGLYGQKNSGNHYLLEFKNTNLKLKPRKILLNLDLVSCFPVSDQNIEVYGFLRHQNLNGRNINVFVVKFWKNINSEFKQYLSVLRSQKLWVPNFYQVLINNSDNFNITEMGRSAESSVINFSFEDIDEDSLNKNIEYIEHLAVEFEEMMNISEDVFM